MKNFWLSAIPLTSFFFFLTSHLCDICISLFLIRITGSSFCNLSVSVSFSFPSCNEILPVGMCSPEYWHPALWGSGMAIIVAIKFCFRLIERLFKMYFLYPVTHVVLSEASHFMSLHVAQIPYPEALYIMCAFTLSSDVELNGGKNKIS